MFTCSLPPCSTCRCRCTRRAPRWSGPRPSSRRRRRSKPTGPGCAPCCCATKRAQLETYGITRDEAAARLDALSDEEVAEIAGKLDALPAGGTGHYGYEALGTLILLAAVAVVVLVVLIFEAIVQAIGGESSESPESSDETPESADAVTG